MLFGIYLLCLIVGRCKFTMIKRKGVTVIAEIDYVFNAIILLCLVWLLVLTWWCNDDKN